VYSDGTVNPRAGLPQLFVVIGAQRTGTNLLRELLNTNEHIAMLGEILMPSPAPAHWDNFCRALRLGGVVPANCREAQALLDRYFEFVEYRIRNHWADNEKSGSRAFGVDIKYNQLARIAPADSYPGSLSPFILRYLQSRGAILIHTTRNVIHCAISALIALQRHFWHNYEGAVIKQKYHIGVEECLGYARTILHQRALFLSAAGGCQVIECPYESLIADIERSTSLPDICDGAGPLRDIVIALGVPFGFRYYGRLQKAINVPYAKLISNYDALVKGLCDSEFSALASSLK
jgi:LPS sulfotransferase NodH